jgi:hypothetical protein
MEKMIKKGSQAYFFHCYSMEASSNEIDAPKGLDKILGKHSTIVQDLPQGLPLVRSRDHIIQLIPSSYLVRRKSYKQF